MMTMESRHAIKDFNFFFGGHALFTISGPNRHYTYKISTPKKLKNQSNPPLFVNLLTGPDNTSSYTYMGLLKGDRVITTKKSKFDDDSQPVRVINWGLKMIQEGKQLPEGYSILHEGKCCRCGRLLTDPQSIEMGIGPHCRNM